MTQDMSFFLPLLLFPIAVTSIIQYEPTCPTSFSGYKAGPGCTTYYICSNGQLASPITECQPGTIFSEVRSVCDLEGSFQCKTTLPPTSRPTKQPTHSPTSRLAPSTLSPTLPPQTRSPLSNVEIENVLEYAKQDVNTKLFVYQSGWSDLDLLPSTIYRYDGFISGLQVMYINGVGDMKFYLGEDMVGRNDVTLPTKIGLVNIAAFLAQSMKETIKYNACDENNWDVINGKYPLSNACGQLEQSYQDYTCPKEYEHMSCDVDINMEMKASTQATWYGAPGPLFCAPRSKQPFTGYWDYEKMCDNQWADPPQYCTDYVGQKGGGYNNDEPVMNGANRTDVEGCCWWGRGVIQTTGVCNYGMLNYYLGKRAADEGREARYPSIDFCKDPGAICNREEYPELKWIAGMFYWIQSLQTYNDGWYYIDNVKNFVEGGMRDDSFIDAVSGIVNRGCHNPPCENGTGPLDGGSERRENFRKVLDVFFEEDGSPRKYRLDDNDMANLVTTARDEEEEEEDWSWVDNDEEVASPPPPPPPQTPKPIAALPPPPTPNTPINNIGKKGQYCLKSLAALDTDCPTAKTCNGDSDECPDGTYCWKERMCGKAAEETPPPPLTIQPTPKITPQPITTNKPTRKEFDMSDTYFCGSDSVSAALSCHKRCRSGLDSECDGGETCFGYTSCKAEVSRPPITKAETKQPTKVPTNKPVQNPTPRPTSKQTTAAPQSTDTQQLLCASSLEELETTYRTAESCEEGPCTSGLFCFPFKYTDDNSTPLPPTPPPSPKPITQQQPVGDIEVISIADRGVTCPKTEFVGWHTSTDCTEYFRCNKGSLGVVKVCPPDEKFDKVRSQCHSKEYVNSFCYGPPMAKEQVELCKEGYTGWESRNACREYYFCDRGIADAIFTCGQDLLFDMRLELCNFANNVKCLDEQGNPITPQPTPRPTKKPQVTAITPLLTPLPTKSPVATRTVSPIASESESSTVVGNETGGTATDMTPTPTVIVPSHNTSAIPPWLQLNTIMSNDGACTLKGGSLYWALSASLIICQVLW